MSPLKAGHVQGISWASGCRAAPEGGRPSAVPSGVPVAAGKALPPSGDQAPEAEEAGGDSGEGQDWAHVSSPQWTAAVSQRVHLGSVTQVALMPAVACLRGAGRATPLLGRGVQGSHLLGATLFAARLEPSPAFLWFHFLAAQPSASWYSASLWPGPALGHPPTDHEDWGDPFGFLWVVTGARSCCLGWPVAGRYLGRGRARARDPFTSCQGGRYWGPRAAVGARLWLAWSWAGKARRGGGSLSLTLWLLCKPR